MKKAPERRRACNIELVPNNSDVFIAKVTKDRALNQSRLSLRESNVLSDSRVAKGDIYLSHTRYLRS